MCTCVHMAVASGWYGYLLWWLCTLYNEARSLTWTLNLLIWLVRLADLWRESLFHFHFTGITGRSLHSPTFKWFLGIQTPVQVSEASPLLSSSTFYSAGSEAHEVDTLLSEPHPPSLCLCNSLAKFVHQELDTEKLGTHSMCKAGGREGSVCQLVHTR